MQRVHPVRLALEPHCGTGFSREGVRRYAANLGVDRHTAHSMVPRLAPSRLKPVPLNPARASSEIGAGTSLWDRLQPGRRRALRRKFGRRSPHCTFDGAQTGPFPAEAGPTKPGACIQGDWCWKLIVGPALAGKASGATPRIWASIATLHIRWCPDWPPPG